MPVRRRAGERLPTVWDFETDPQYQSKLDWVEKFMAEELEPLDLVALDPYDKKNADTMAILRPLQRQVKDQGLWAAHLRPELGGQWLIDKHHDYQKVRRDIAAVKVAMPQVLHDVVQRAMHLHGALGVSDEMPFVKMMLAAESLGIADGATELHKMTVARRTLREYQPVTTLFPSQHIPTRRAHAEAWLAQRLEHAIAEF